mgnify:CR=1 FL=1
MSLLRYGRETKINIMKTLKSAMETKHNGKGMINLKHMKRKNSKIERLKGIIKIILKYTLETNGVLYRYEKEERKEVKVMKE